MPPPPPLLDANLHAQEFGLMTSKSTRLRDSRLYGHVFLVIKKQATGISESNHQAVPRWLYPHTPLAPLTPPRSLDDAIIRPPTYTYLGIGL